MDGTVKSRGPSHRVDRHEINKTPEKAYEIFKDKVPQEYRKFIKDAVKDHIELDRRKEKITNKFEHKEINVPENITKKVFDGLPNLPYRKRGIKIHQYLIQTTLKILNDAEDRTLPQNARNLSVQETPDGLDKRIKIKLGTDLRTANIVSDELEETGAVEVKKIKNPDTGRKIKATKLLEEFSW